MRTCLLLAGLVVVGCTGASSTTRTISGRIAPGFPDSITRVEVLQGTSRIATGAVASDGRFSFAVPLASGLALRFVGAGHSNLVMPRRSGGLQQTFMLGAGPEVALGSVHFVGVASTTSFSFHTDPATECDDDDHDTTGATCVDDEDGNDQCDGDDDHDGDGSGSGSDDFVGTHAPDTSGMTGDDSDGPDDGDSVPDHDIDEDCAGSGSGSGSGSSGSGTM